MLQLGARREAMLFYWKAVPKSLRSMLFVQASCPSLLIAQLLIIYTLFVKPITAFEMHLQVLATSTYVDVDNVFHRPAKLQPLALENLQFAVAKHEQFNSQLRKKFLPLVLQE